MVDTPNYSIQKLLGAGRSGQVFLADTPDGLVAKKIFFEDKIANLIHYFFFGVPNPYVWNKDALSCAYYRRKILRKLVRFWFNSQLRVADAINMGWNEEFMAYELDTELIQGRHIALQHPFNQKNNQELHELVHSIMIPFQKQLIQSGFDGLVWQAGKGSSTAINNFLLESQTAEKYVFVCIDLESGVPALFPLNILTLFSFYLPKSIKHGGALFDDVDISKLKQYLYLNTTKLEEKLGNQEFSQLLEYIPHLEYHQKKWKSLKRINRSILYQLHKGDLSQQQGDWYLNYPLFWYGRELGRIILLILNTLAINLPLKIFNKLRKIPYTTLVKQFFNFFYSQSYRLKVARDYVKTRIRYWQKRKQIKTEEAEYLYNRLSSENASDYLNDFSVHFGIKLFVKSLEFLLVPFLYSLGLINETIVILWLIMGGPIYRTIYTIFRMIQLAKKSQEIPWIAFIVGLFPTFGTLAYPCQMIYSAVGKQEKVAQFIVYDFLTRLGTKIPAWGGEDTLTEHFFNDCADKVVCCFQGKNR
ncbi:hypothetical protein VB735_23730 [Halotia wernerae UHCC 0503]|nr:hypothetical protein [Halotia wernerae UHCC 0503]